MICMSIAMILALRPRWPEPSIGGLDKMYRLHKWLGIGGLVFAILHWLWSQGPKWAVGLGSLALSAVRRRPVRVRSKRLSGLGVGPPKVSANGHSTLPDC
jgi:predicted ferric reductase